MKVSNDLSREGDVGDFTIPRHHAFEMTVAGEFSFVAKGHGAHNAVPPPMRVLCPGSMPSRSCRLQTPDLPSDRLTRF